MSSANFKLNQKVELLIRKSKASSKTMKGEIVYISDHFITVQNSDHIRESFNFIDFSLGTIQVKN